MQLCCAASNSAIIYTVDKEKLMDEQVANFKQQIQSNIYNNAFCDTDKWRAHLIYMIYNPDNYWLNILSVFNFRDAPVRVQRHAAWKDKIAPANPIIKKGLTGIPILVKENKENMIGVKISQERIVHDAWDINDLMDGDKLILTSPFFDEIKRAQKNGLSLDSSFWESFIENIMANRFSSLSHDVKKLLSESFLYIIYGTNEINLDIVSIHKNSPTMLCRIYKNMVKLLQAALASFRDYVASEIAKTASEKEKEAFQDRMQRKLPQRLEDATIRLSKKGG